MGHRIAVRRKSFDTTTLVEKISPTPTEYAMEKIADRFIELEEIVRRDSTLIVDSSMSFVGTVKKMRAANLILKGKGYELIARQDSVVESNFLAIIGNPLVVALNRYVPKKINEIDPDSVVSKRMILSRDGYICSYCGDFGNTVDHIIPRSKGGGSTWGNLTTACRDCNGKKGNESNKDVGYTTPKIPRTYVPRRDIEIQAAIHKRLEDMMAL